jgi:O-antigen/teichoic acid export membrane protein
VIVSEEVRPSTRRLAGGTLVLLSVRAAGLVMGLLVSLLLARGLGAGALGTFATGLTLVHIGTMLTEFGLRFCVGQFLPAPPQA